MAASWARRTTALIVLTRVLVGCARRIRAGATFVVVGEGVKEWTSRDRIPLSPLALKIITEARELAPDSRWLFPSPKGDRPIDANARRQRH